DDGDVGLGGGAHADLHYRNLRICNIGSPMPPGPSTRLPAAERREQLLDVTKGIVTERGFAAVSIEAVARGAGITRPIIYGHFTDLQGLLEALLRRESARALR